MDDEFVRTVDCERHVRDLKSELKKQGLALFGQDGRGGIQHDITTMRASVERVEKRLNGETEIEIKREEISVKRLVAYMTVICTIITVVLGPIVVVIAQRIMNGG